MIKNDRDLRKKVVVPLTMKRRNGVETLAHKNSPSIVFRAERQLDANGCSKTACQPTMDSTIMESLGNGVEYTSPDEWIIVGIGGLSVSCTETCDLFPLENVKLGRPSWRRPSDIFPDRRRAALGSSDVPSAWSSAGPKTLVGACVCLELCTSIDNRETAGR